MSVEQINTKELMKEHRVLHDLINYLINLASITSETIKEMRQSAKETALNATASSSYGYGYRQINSTTDIAKRDKLLKYSTSEISYRNSYTKPEGIGNVNYKGVYNNYLKLIQSSMNRQECLIRLVNEYANIDNIQANADKGADRARLAYHQIQSGTPYRWEFQVIGKKGAKLPSVTKWKIEERSMFTGQRDMNGRYIYKKEPYYVPKHTWYIDETYLDTVDKYNIHTTDIAGKRCFTLKAELIEEHELKDQGVTLFKAIVGYTKVGSNSKDTSKAGVRASIYTEERWIAVQDQNDERVEQATGKDKSWAIRTMKQRMKSTMLKKMGLK